MHRMGVCTGELRELLLDEIDRAAHEGHSLGRLLDQVYTLTLHPNPSPSPNLNPIPNPDQEMRLSP